MTLLTNDSHVFDTSEDTQKVTRQSGLNHCGLMLSEIKVWIPWDCLITRFDAVQDFTVQCWGGVEFCHLVRSDCGEVVLTHTQFSNEYILLKINVQLIYFHVVPIQRKNKRRTLLLRCC